MQSHPIALLKMVTNLHIGGTERQVVNLVQRLNASLFDLHLACLRSAGELLNELETLPIAKPEFQIGSFHSAGTFREAVHLGKYLRRNRIQILHTYGFYPNVFAIPVGRLVGTPVIVASIRDTGEVLTPMQRGVQRMVCRLADCVLVNAEAIREQLVRQGYPADKIRVIRNGVVLPRFGSKDRSGRLRQELKLPPDARLVVVFSRLNPMKGVEYFIDAAAATARRFADVYFLIVGDGENRAELQAQARRAGIDGRMVFTGFRSDIPEFLSEASISVLPSLSEGLSNTLLESMAAGVAVIATRVGGNPEVIEDGVTGLLVPPRDSDEIAGALHRLLGCPDLALRLGECGARRVAQLFAVERAVRETESLYLRLLSVGDRA